MKRIALLFFIPVLLFAQDYANSIKIRANSTVYVKANSIKFNIGLHEENPLPKEAFNKHKILEKKLLDLLKQYNISDSSVAYSLLNFRKYPNPQREEVYRTDQNVIVKLNSINDYTDFQISLLDNGFSEFNAVFSSDELSNTKEHGYKEALRLASEDAEAIAKAMHKKVGKILEVNTQTSDNPYIDSRRGSITALSIKTSDRDLTEIEQSLEVRTSIEVRFEIMEE